MPATSNGANDRGRYRDNARAGGASADLRRKLGLLVCLVVIVVASGCDIRVRMGRPIDADALEKSLVIGESGKNDLRRVLGQPFAKGETMMPFEKTPRLTWAYLYNEGDMKDSRTTVLLVYFDRDRYDGYMWYSSLAKK